ncbi:hypothetical protein L3Y34_003314 [Caenorhabditis briggsae]|uniref:DUF38 domain-containing protein n=2 Tax=Caenorhabditis briggsae TaxID=6238 RepID=A0AAE9D3Z8_CAEBR|nr:hypothetical protein L3Y34_003314 [Caenorhabditis briggsae]
MAHTFLTNRQALKQHIQPRFEARWSIPDVHREVCQMIRDGQQPTNYVPKWTMFPGKSLPSNNTLVTTASASNSREASSGDARSGEVVDNTKQLRVGVINRQLKCDKRGVEIYENQYGDLIKITKILEIYEEKTMKMFKELNKDRLITAKDNIYNILFHRRHSLKCYREAKGYSYPLQKVKFIVGYKEIKIEILLELTGEIVTLEYGCLRGDRCAVVYGDSTFQLDKSCDEVAAVDFHFLLKSPLLQLAELEFFFEPYNPQYPAHFPDTSVLARVARMFLDQRIAVTSVKKLSFMFTREVMFMEKSARFRHDSSIIGLFLKHLKSCYLEEIVLRVWNDHNLITSSKDLQTVIREFVERNKKTEIQMEGLILECDSWKNAKILNIEDSLIARDWARFLHFHTVCVLQMDVNRILNAKNIFQQKDMLPYNGFTIQVQEEMNLAEIRIVFQEIRDLVVTGVGNNQLVASCLTNDKKDCIIITIDNRNIVITHRRSRKNERVELETDN